MAAPEPDEVEVARAVGCRVRKTGDFVVNGETFGEYALDCADNDVAIRYLDAMASRDAKKSERVQAIAESVKGATDAATAANVQSFVQGRIKWLQDDVQVFRSSDVTLELGTGNCVNTARLAAAILRAAGVGARVVGVTNADGDVVHASAQALVGPGWQWIECSVPARYGESPYDAARRMSLLLDGIRRVG